MTVTAPGKLLLFGEHAAVFGYPAVGIALPRVLTVTARPALDADPALVLEIPGATVKKTDIAAFVEYLREVAGRFPAAKVPAQTLTVTSELPMSSGFGSSAALCTALARWMLPPESRSDAVWTIANELERFFHGTPSGIDTGLSCLGGAQAFRFSETAPGTLPRAASVELPAVTLVAGSIPRSRSTKELVAGVRARREDQPERYGPLLERLGALSADTADDASGLVEPFARRVREAQRLLGDLGVSTPELDRIITAGERAGALAGKLSGAGGGGAFYLLCPDPAAAERVRAVIAAAHPAAGTTFIVELPQDISEQRV